MAFQHISTSFRRNLQAAHIQTQVTAATVVAAFEPVLAECCGPAISTRVKAATFRDGTLKLLCLSSTISREVKKREPEIIAALNQRLGGGAVVKQLRFVVGTLSPDQPSEF